jgi:CDP-diacylglycerol---glycerol-3-phosphate 3-phosphatidyltransferase
MELKDHFPKLQPTDKIIDKTILWAIPHNWLPNHFTIARFIMTPIVIWLILKEQFLLALITFIVAALTDAIDGAMARLRHQITEWGKIYDPVADKLLIGATAFLLIDRYLSLYLALAIVFIEIFLIVNGGIRKNKGKVVQANRWGKIKMILQVGGVGFIFLFLLTSSPILLTVSWIILAFAVFFGLISLFTYSI